MNKCPRCYGMDEPSCPVCEFGIPQTSRDIWPDEQKQIDLEKFKTTPIDGKIPTPLQIEIKEFQLQALIDYPPEHRRQCDPSRPNKQLRALEVNEILLENGYWEWEWARKRLNSISKEEWATVKDSFDFTTLILEFYS